MSSFKSNENIHKKEAGSYYVVSANKASSCFPSQQGNPPAAILFVLTAAAAITLHTKSYEIAAVTMHSFVKFNFSSPSVSLCNAP